MLVVTDLNGNTEALTDVQGAEINEEVNADFSLSFTSFLTANNAHSYPLLMEESLLELDGHEYRVKQLSEVKNRKTVKALHIFFDLIDKRKDEVISGTKTANEVFTFLLSGTGWTFQIVGNIPKQSFTNFGDKNVLELIRKACEVFECELKIEPGKKLTIKPEIGADLDEQFRYKHNIKTLKRDVNTTNLTTCIKGTGAEGVSAFYKSPNVSKYGERWAEPVSDERYTSVATLTERLKKEIQDVPEVSIDIEVISLGINASLGDKVWTIYEPLNIEFQTRVMAMKRYPFTNKSPVVSLNNRMQTVTDFLTDTKQEIDENKEELEQDLEEAEKRFKSKFEQTDERISLEVEELEASIAKVELEADNIALSVNNRITNEIAQVNVRADNISLNVQRVQENLGSDIAAVDIKADNISWSVQRATERLGSAESQISMQAGQIQSKVSNTDYNGNTIKSLISQSSSSIQIEAQQIALRGVVTSDNIQVGNEIRLGYSGWNGTKSLIFNDRVYLSSDGDVLVVNTTGGVDFQSYVSFSSPVTGVANTRRDQQVSLSFDGDLTMNVTVNGRTAKFKPV